MVTDLKMKLKAIVCAFAVVCRHESMTEELSRIRDC